MSDYQAKQQTKVGLWKVCLTAGLFIAVLRSLVSHDKDLKSDQAQVWTWVRSLGISAAQLWVTLPSPCSIQGKDSSPEEAKVSSHHLCKSSFPTDSQHMAPLAAPIPSTLLSLCTQRRKPRWLSPLLSRGTACPPWCLRDSCASLLTKAWWAVPGTGMLGNTIPSPRCSADSTPWPWEEPLSKPRKSRSSRQQPVHGHHALALGLPFSAPHGNGGSEVAELHEWWHQLSRQASRGEQKTLQQTKRNRVQISRANEETKEHRHKDLCPLREPRDECRGGGRGKAWEPVGCLS